MWSTGEGEIGARGRGRVPQSALSWEGSAHCRSSAHPETEAGAEVRELCGGSVSELNTLEVSQS